jgi:hypothetical protein
MAEERKPPRRGSAGGSSSRGSSSRTGSTGSSRARKPAAKKPAAAKKTAAAKKPAAKKPAAKKAPAKTAAAKKPAAKRTQAKKPAAKRTQAKKPAAKSRASSRSAPKPTPEQLAPDAEEKKPKRSESTNGQPEQELPTAPSLGPNTVIEREPVEERLARHEQSDVDAMGKDKRRQVVGQTYGPTFARQATLYGLVIAVIAALGVGGKLLADKLDEPPATNPDKAPWSAPDAKQHPPKPLQ